jgi:RalA-binding protein 1
MIGHNMINLYLHEVALHTKTAVDQIRPPFHPDTFKDGVVGTSEPLSTAHIGAISACIAAVEGIFTTFLSMDVRDIRCLPVYNFVRVAYGVVILVKMYFSASSQGSELGKVIDKGTLRVEQYLDALLDKFRQTANGDGSRPAAKFRFVLGMLRSWLLKQDGRYEGRNGERGRSMRSGSSGVSAAESSSQQQPQPQQQQSANTPLQLLSEVASNSDASRTRAAYFSVVDGIRQPSQTFFHDSTATPTAATSTELQQQQQQQPAAFPDTSSSWATSPQQQQQPPGLPMDMTGLSASGLGMTPAFPSMGGFAPVPEDEDGARFVISEPWFTDVFQGFQGFQEDTTMFPF